MVPINKVPSNIRNDILNLVGDAQFQKRVNTDKVLDTLEAQKLDKNVAFQELLLLLNRRTLLFGVAYKPITLALFSYLYCIQSKIITDIIHVTKEDLDIFFYLLQTKNYTYDLKDLIVKSSDYCNKELNLSPGHAFFIFNKLYTIQFKVLSLFPKTCSEDDQPICDVDWMLNIVSKVKPYTSYTTKEMYTEVPVMQLYYYYAHFRRNNGDNSVFRRDNEQILDEMDSRVINMVIDRLIQKNILTKSQRKEYFKLLKQGEENKNGK